MGEIPLLTREQEINLAKKIEITRKRFRRKVLECHFALALVVDVLKKVNDGELPFDRTVKVSVTENLEKDQILGRMPHNLATLDHLMELQHPGLPGLRPRTRSADRATALMANLRRRRRKAVNLVEELSIRTQKVQPLMKRLEQVSAPDGRAARPARDHRAGRGGKEDRANLRKGAQGPDADHPRDSQEPQAAGRAHERPVQASTSRPSASSPAATSGWSSRSPRSTATAACRSWT